MRHAITLMLLLLAGGCPRVDDSNGGGERKPSSGPLNVVCTTGMVADMVSNIGGAHVKVTTLMGAGVDPHLFRASEGDVATLSNADAIFYSGLHLEAKLADLLEQMSGRKPTFAVTSLIPEEELLGWSGVGGSHDPHVWFDVALWSHCIERVESGLAELQPDNAAEFKVNAAKYATLLAELHTYVKEQALTIPKAQRVLVTAHDAFRYFGRAYEFEVVGLQGISTEAQAGTGDVQKLAELIATRKIPAIFVESSVPKRNIEAVQAAVKSRGWDVQIGGSLFSDALGDAGTVEGTYAGMVRHNVDTITNALKRNES